MLSAPPLPPRTSDFNHAPTPTIRATKMTESSKLVYISLQGVSPAFSEACPASPIFLFQGFHNVSADEKEEESGEQHQGHPCGSEHEGPAVVHAHRRFLQAVFTPLQEDVLLKISHKLLPHHEEENEQEK